MTAARVAAPVASGGHALLRSTSAGGPTADLVLDALPADLRDAMSPAGSPDDAEAFTRRLTRTHYENFPVVSAVLPVLLRQDFCNVYAFCRVADDLGDELGDRDRSSAWLAELHRRVSACFAGREDSVLFAALGRTVRRHDLPPGPFLDLIDAFDQDQRVSRYETFADVAEYCRRSANPVGRLVLFMCGYRDEERHRLSDATCTALQLANFWQDVVEDKERGRRYIPAEWMDRFQIDEGQIEGRIFTPEFGAMMCDLVTRTRAMLAEGGEITRHVDRDLAVTLNLFRKGGDAILDGIAAQEYDVLRGRPVVSKSKKLSLLVGSLFEKLRSRISW